MLIIILGTYMFQDTIGIYVNVDLVWWAKKALLKKQVTFKWRLKGQVVLAQLKEDRERVFQANALENMSACLEVREDLADGRK